jgi:hypothetical protein
LARRRSGRDGAPRGMCSSCLRRRAMPGFQHGPDFMTVDVHDATLYPHQGFSSFQRSSIPFPSLRALGFFPRPGRSGERLARSARGDLGGHTGHDPIRLRPRSRPVIGFRVECGYCRGSGRVDSVPDVGMVSCPEGPDLPPGPVASRRSAFSCACRSTFRRALSSCLAFRSLGGSFSGFLFAICPLLGDPSPDFAGFGRSSIPGQSITRRIRFPASVSILNPDSRFPFGLARISVGL